MNNNIQLSKKQLREKKKILLKYERDIKSLESDLKHPKIANLKIYSTKVFKITKRTVRFLVPYVLITGGVFAPMHIAEETPFVMNDQTKELNIKKEIDSSGNIRYEHSYDEFESTEKLMMHYSKWEKVEDGYYHRTVDTYKPKKLTEEEVLELLDKENLVLDNILGKPIKSIDEVKSNISEEELKKSDYFSAIIFDENREVTIIEKETEENNVIATFFYLLFSILGITPVALIKTTGYIKDIKEINKRYQPIREEDIQRKLQFKKEFYKLKGEK